MPGIWPDLGVLSGVRPRGPSEDLVDHRRERLQREIVVAGVEAVLVVALAELDGVGKPLVAPVPLAHSAHVGRILVHLEDRVMLHDPRHPLGHLVCRTVNSCDK